MTKSELVRRMAELHPHLQHSDVERVVETIFASIGNALARGDRIEIRGFGSFASSIAARASAGTPEPAPQSKSRPRSSPTSRPASSARKLNEER